MTGFTLNTGQRNVLAGDMALIALGILFFLRVQFIKGKGMLGFLPGLIDFDVAYLAFLDADIGGFLSRNPPCCRTA
jgi:hypothetical protein